MKLNIFTKSMIGMGLVCSALPALAMEAWNNQQGGNKYQVIFDGKIYENAWWVSSTNCPGKAKANDATNPWRLKRTATAAEISQFGNTLSCEKSGSSSSSNSNTPASNTPANGGSATPAQGTVPSNSSVVAWNKQQGGQTWYVVFNGAVYKNAWWVASSNCPGDAKSNDASNPWRYVRAATATEISQYGNPGSCSVKPDNNGGAVTPVDPTPE
ncbi:chitinase, partial [Escherichia coli]|nr:chitinase [Escherichia coli]